MRKWVFLATLFCLSLSFGYKPQSGQVNGFVGPFVHQTDYDSSRIFHDDRWANAFGLLLTGDVNEKSAIEISIFHMYKTFFREAQQRILAQRTGYLHISMGYRRYFSEKWSASLSFFSGYTMGKLRTIYSSYLPTDERPTSGNDITEYGFDLAVQYEIWSRQEQALVVDTRYAISVTNKVKEYGNHYGLYLAYRWLIR